MGFGAVGLANLLGKKLLAKGNEFSSLNRSVAPRAKRVIFLLVIGKYCFLGTEQGLFRINLKTHRMREYSFDFVGSVNSLAYTDKFIWIGTNEGVLRFKWRKDL